MAIFNIISEVKNGNINFSIKEWKRKSFYIVKELKERKSFEKPCEKRRKMVKNAKNKNRYKLIEEQSE